MSRLSLFGSDNIYVFTGTILFLSPDLSTILLLFFILEAPFETLSPLFPPNKFFLSTLDGEATFAFLPKVN
jgi:hypothetical protein